MADLGSFSSRTIFRVSGDIRLPRVFYEQRTLGTFRSEPLRSYRFAAIDQYNHQLEIWGLDLPSGTVEEKTGTVKPSVMAATAITGEFSAEQYDCAFGPSLTLDVDSKPPMFVVYFRPDSKLGCYMWDVYRDQVNPLWSATAGPSFDPIMRGFGATWNGADGYLYGSFFACGSQGGGADKREVIILRGFFRNTSPVNYKGATSHAYNSQTGAWRTLGGPPPPSWGINKEQDPVQLIPSDGGAQAIWKTNSALGIATNGHKPRIEETGIRTAPSDAFGSAIQQINDDPTENLQLAIGNYIGAYAIDDLFVPTLKMATVERGAVDRIHVYRTTPHVSTSVDQWSEETVEDPPISGILWANLALTGDRMGMVGQESGRQWLYADGNPSGSDDRWIYRARFDVVQSKWTDWIPIVNLSTIPQEAGEFLLYTYYNVIPGDDNNLLLIEAQDMQETLSGGAERARRVFALLDPAEVGPTTGGISGPGRPTLVISSGGSTSGSASWVG